MKKIKALLYCTKAKPYLYDLRNIMGIFGGYNVKQINLDFLLLNGKIVAECEIEVEEITPSTWNAETERRILKGSCLKEHQLFDYIIKGDENESQNPLYALHISNLNIFDEPRELSDFNKIIETTYGEEPDETITRAPQNMMRCCYEKKPKEWKTGVLISIQPQWLCKILNGEKDIEVRKQVLNCMKGNK